MAPSVTHDTRQAVMWEEFYIHHLHYLALSEAGTQRQLDSMITRSICSL